MTARGYHNIKRLLAVGQWKGMCVTNNGAAIRHRDGQGRLPQYHRKGAGAADPHRCAEAGEAVQPAASAGVQRHLRNFRAQIPTRACRTCPKADPCSGPGSGRCRYRTHSIDEMVEALGDDTELLCIHGKDGREFSGAFYRSIIQLGDFMLTSSHPGGFDIMAAGSTKREGRQAVGVHDGHWRAERR